MWPSDSESTTNIFAGPRDAPLSVCLFQPPLSSNKGLCWRVGIRLSGFFWYAASVNTWQVQLSVGVFMWSVWLMSPPPAAAAAAVTLPHPTNPTRTPTELMPPDDDSVDCFGSKLMSAAARFAQGAAGGMWQRAQGSSPSSDCLLGTHLLTCFAPNVQKSKRIIAANRDF